MVSFRAEPFLWIHLAGIVVVPLAGLSLTCCLAIGTPFVPIWLEILLLLAIGWLPISLMQWFKPFEIFSLLLIALRPGSLTESQRQILALFKRPRQRLVTLLGALVSLGSFWLVYLYAPVAYGFVLLLPQNRLLGLLIAAISYFIFNLFLQVPLSVLGVLLTSSSTFSRSQPLTNEEIKRSFTIPGVKIREIPLIPRYIESHR